MNIAFTSKVFNGSIDPKAESNNESLKDISTYGHFLNFE